ncbi:hypothetical protein G3I13_19690 [Streptomyces sp. SID6673]|nr:hypothetical protein [Streptomyces sp. SID11726]NEB26561.1 hypothetical protein [Streptomyces sp. SID6673]
MNNSENLLTMRWAKYSSFVYRPNFFRLATVFAIGLAGVVLSFAMAVPLMAVVCTAIALIPVVLVIPQCRRVEAERDRVVVRRQPLLRNAVLWLSVVCGVAAVATVALMATGVAQDWRLVISAAGFACVAPILGVASYRDRGPLTVSSTDITFGNGMRYAFNGATISYRELSNGVPAVFCESARDGVKRSTRLLARPYDLDFNTLMSTLEQLQAWHRQGRSTTSVEIRAMLTVIPPGNVELGESVQLEVLVEDGSERR